MLCPRAIPRLQGLIKNVKTLAMQYKTNNNEPTSHTFTNFLFQTKSITIPIGNSEYLLRFFKLNPDHFSIDGPIQIHPVSQTGHLDDPSAVNENHKNLRQNRPSQNPHSQATHF